MADPSVKSNQPAPAAKSQTLTTSKIASKSNSLAENQGRLERLRQETGAIRAEENSSGNSAVDNQNGQRQGNAYVREVNNSNQEKVIQAQIDSDKKAIADLQTEAGKTTSVSEVSPSDSVGPAKSGDSSKGTPDGDLGKSTPESQAQTARSLSTLAPGGKDPNQADLVAGVEKFGGRQLDTSDRTMVSQFKGEANINEDAASNRNCGRAALLSTARALGLGGDASTANADLEKIGTVMGQNGGNEHQGTQLNEFVAGARNLGMNAKLGRGSIEQVKQQLQNGNQVVVATDPSKYSGFTKKGGHLTRVSGYNAERDTFTLHDSLFQKPIEIEADKLAQSMGSQILGDGRNAMIVVDKNSKVDENALDKVSRGTTPPSPASVSSPGMGDTKSDGEVIKGSAGNEPSRVDNSSRKNVDADTDTTRKKEDESEGESEGKPQSPGELYPGSPYFGKWAWDGEKIVPIESSKSNSGQQASYSETSRNDGTVEMTKKKD